jgi:penicillin G amidase
VRHVLVVRDGRVHPAWYVVSVVLLLFVLVGGTVIVIQQSRVATDGEYVSIAGSAELSAHIAFDANAIPTITANSYQAAVAGLGYAEASQRLYQMQQFLWTVQGTLSRHLGPGEGNANVSSDLLFGILDLTSQATAAYNRASDLTKEILAAYAQGINTYLQSHTLPHEFGALGVTTLPAWTPANSMAILMEVTAGLDINTWLTKIAYSALASSSPALAEALIPVAPNSPSMFDAVGNLTSPSVFLSSNGFDGTLPASSDANLSVKTVVAAGTVRAASSTEPSRVHSLVYKALSRAGIKQLMEGLERLRAAFPQSIAIPGGPESNNWVVAGAYTADGKPLIANDTHILFSTPSLTYLANLVLPYATISGMTAPGLPVYLSFLTTHGDGTTLSAAITYAMADVDDIYAETTRTSSTCPSGQEAFMDGAWQCMTARDVTIEVAGGKPIVLTIVSDSHGSIINPAFAGALDPFGQLAIQMASSKPEWTIDGIFSLPLVTSPATIDQALSHISIALSFVWAYSTPTTSDIGYHMTGLIPVRSRANGVRIVPGNDPAYAWRGVVPFAKLPYVTNPASGYINTSNNRLVPDDYVPGGTPVYISREWDVSFRAQTVARQLATWIASGHKITVADMAALQLNTVSGAAQVTIPVLLGIARRVGSANATEAGDLAALASWDGDVSADSHAASVYEAWMAMLDRNLQAPNTSALYQFYAQAVWIGSQQQATYQQLVNPTLLTRAQRDAWVMMALADAETLLKSAGATTWGDLHRLIYNHPFSVPGTSYYDPRYAIGPASGYGRPGDPFTVNTGGWDSRIGLLALPPNQYAATGGAQAAFAQDAGPSSRVIWSVGHPDSSLVVGSTGEDGEPGPQYTTMPEQWRDGIYLRIRSS